MWPKGHKQASAKPEDTSASPPTADIGARSRQVRDGPQPDAWPIAASRELLTSRGILRMVV
jgi:hypothetical protein